MENDENHKFPLQKPSKSIKNIQNPIKTFKMLLNPSKTFKILQKPDFVAPWGSFGPLWDAIGPFGRPLGWELAGGAVRGGSEPIL